MWEQKVFVTFIILASVRVSADTTNVDTTSATPPVKSRFFGLNGILDQIFNLPNHLPAGGGYFNPRPYPAQQNPPTQGNWQNVQTPQQFPNQGQGLNQFNSDQYPPGSGNTNTGNDFGVANNQNLNTGTLDDIPTQNGIQQPGFQNQNAQGVDYNPVAVLGKPVSVPPNSFSDSIVFPDGSDTPAQIQCVQDCQSSTEYNPVCGSNNMTYYNPGRFVCARNCGIYVFLQRPGRCFD